MGLLRSCDGTAGWLLVLRQHFPRKQKQLAQQNKMYTGGLSEELPGKLLLFLGGESRRQLSAFSPSSRTEQVSQALIITHCSLEFPSPCFLNTELPAFPFNPKQESLENPSFQPPIIPVCSQASPWGLATLRPGTAPAAAAGARTELCLTCSFPFSPVFSRTATIPEAQCSLTLAVLICF